MIYSVCREVKTGCVMLEEERRGNGRTCVEVGPGPVV